MKGSLIFLGSGGDPMVVGKQLRGAGGFIIRAEGNQFHIDPGPGALTALSQFGINVREHTAIFLSHKHLNHAHDADAIISSMTYNGMDPHGVLVAPKQVVEDKAVGEFFTGCVERYISFNEESRIAINEIEVEGCPAKHGDAEAVGFKFSAPDFTLGYTGDTGYFSKLGEFYSDVDILVINCKNPMGVNERGHLNAEDAVNLVEKAKPKVVVLTHFGIKALKGDPLNIAREVQKRTKVQTLAAKDGFSLDPKTFASRVRQKKLRSFD